MLRFAWALFVVTLVAGAALIVGSESRLPQTVATHFGADGRANGWMQRDSYVMLMLALAIGLPLLVAASMAWLPRVAPRLINLPQRERWLASSQLAATLTALSGFGALIGSLVAAFIAGMHLLIVAAHANTPPRLDMAMFLPLLIAFVVAILVGVIVFHRRFRRA